MSVIPVLYCPQCRQPFKSPQRAALYCSRACKQAAANLEANRGRQLYRLAYHWALGSGESFSDLSWLIRQFVKEDRQANRPPPPRLPQGEPVWTRHLTNRGRITYSGVTKP